MHRYNKIRHDCSISEEEKEEIREELFEGDPSAAIPGGHLRYPPAGIYDLQSQPKF